MLKVLLIDEWGGANSIRVASDMARNGAEVYLLKEFSHRIPLPRSIHLLPAVSLDSQCRTEVIGEAVARLQPDAVMPLEEDTLTELWEQAPPWIDLVHPRIDRSLLESYKDKHRMLEFARNLGMRVPATTIPAKAEKSAFDDALLKIGLPVVIKGATGSAGEQVFVCRSELEAWKAFSRLAGKNATPPALQEYIDGVPYQAGGLFEHGRPLQFFVGEKTEILPLITGPAMELISREAQEIVAPCTRLLESLDFTGLAGLDFMRSRNGDFYFLELNPRVWGSFGFADALGINLFGDWIRMTKGERLPSNTSYPLGIRWAKMPEYLFSSPRTPASILRKLLKPVSLRSLAWNRPYLLLYQLRRIFWETRRHR